ncbi:hypothetical protein ANCCAN_25247 [Ancylostoma caninum]|uniref:Uncharacterized protein n=1 Tax=Ancylostoma caninum TaxID=29170 RepID=A0A368FDQ3_ANCCA|nr:hypothetical protein ANCCAN_25247 [Ancylostoma caninum]
MEDEDKLTIHQLFEDPPKVVPLTSQSILNTEEEILDSCENANDEEDACMIPSSSSESGNQLLIKKEPDTANDGYSAEYSLAELEDAYQS